MLRHVDDVLGQDLDAVVAGPGLGRTEHAATLVGAVLASDWPCVLDADALNLLAEDKDLRDACERRSADTLLTPHPAEAARLLKLPHAEVQADRVAAARRSPKRYNAHVVLKGNGSVLVARDGHSSSTPPATPAWRAPGWATCSPASSAPCSRSALPASRRWCSACTCTAPRPTRWQPTASGRSASPRAS